MGLASRLIVKRNGQFPNHIYAVTAWDGGRARFSIQEGEIYRETDCLLEGDGIEISVPRCLAAANSVGTFISAGEWRLLAPPKQLYRFAEADDRSGDSPAPTVDRPQPDRSLKTAAYLARN